MSNTTRCMFGSPIEEVVACPEFAATLDDLPAMCRHSGCRWFWASNQCVTARRLLGRIPFHPLVGPPHVPAMDAGAERCEFSRPTRVGAEGVLRVLLPAGVVAIASSRLWPARIAFRTDSINSLR